MYSIFLSELIFPQLILVLEYNKEIFI